MLQWKSWLTLNPLLTTTGSLPAHTCTVAAMWTTALHVKSKDSTHTGGEQNLERITVWLREGLKVCIIFLPLWDSLRAGTASLQSTAQLSAAQRSHRTGNFSHTAHSVSAKFLIVAILTLKQLITCVIVALLWCFRVKVLALKFLLLPSGILIKLQRAFLIEMRCFMSAYFCDLAATVIKSKVKLHALFFLIENELWSNIFQLLLHSIDHSKYTMYKQDLFIYQNE